MLEAAGISSHTMIVGGLKNESWHVVKNTNARALTRAGS